MSSLDTFCSVESHLPSESDRICRELRDLSCMAYEHFNEKIAPILGINRIALCSSRVETSSLTSSHDGIVNMSDLNESGVSSENIIEEILHSAFITSIITRINNLERVQAGTSMLLWL